MKHKHCPHGYRYNLDRDPCGPPNHAASDGCAPSGDLLSYVNAYEAVRQAAYDLECAVNKIGWHPGDPLECAKVLAKRADALVEVMKVVGFDL